VEPPFGLGLAAVPVEELGEDPAGVLLVRALGGVDRDAGGQRLDADPRLLELGGQLLGRLAGPGLRATELDLEGRLRLLAEALQPGAQLPDRDAVVAVVGGEVLENAGVAALHPPLVLDEGEARPGLGPLPPGHVELLDLLERVRLLGHPHAVADDPVEVDEHAAAEEAVHLLLARGVATHEALDGP
jgi:hypothetical protein